MKKEREGEGEGEGREGKKRRREERTGKERREERRGDRKTKCTFEDWIMTKVLFTNLANTPQSSLSLLKSNIGFGLKLFS